MKTKYPTLAAILSATKKVQPIPKDWPVQPLKPGQKAKDPATCGYCGLSWDDAIPTSMTPAPAGRCPFEQFHIYEDESAAKVLRISAKCSDLFWASLEDASGNQIGEYDGYVPSWMPDEHYGDYVMLDIDLETGKILNWKKPTPEQLKKTFKK